MRPVWSATEAHPRRDASNVCTHRHGPHRPDRPTPVKRRPRLPTPNESNGSGRYLVATGIDQRTWQTSIGNIYVISDLNGAPERIRTSDLCLRRAAGSDRRARPNNLSGASIRSEIGALVSKDRMVEVQTTLVASPRNQFSAGHQRFRPFEILASLMLRFLAVSGRLPLRSRASSAHFRTCASRLMTCRFGKPQ
jgi:hypothetical protein